VGRKNPRGDRVNPKCPASGSDPWKVGFGRSGHRCFKCRSCGKKFNERAGTPFHGLHKPEQDVLTATVLYVNYPLSSYQVKASTA